MNKNHYREKRKSSWMLSQRGCYHYATNAGRSRGTDIKRWRCSSELESELCIIGTERRGSRHPIISFVDVQVVKVTQVNSQFYLSLEDDLMKRFGSERLKGVFERQYVWQAIESCVDTSRSKQHKNVLKETTTILVNKSFLTMSCVHNVSYRATLWCHHCRSWLGLQEIHAMIRRTVGPLCRWPCPF